MSVNGSLSNDLAIETHKGKDVGWLSVESPAKVVQEIALETVNESISVHR